MELSLLQGQEYGLLGFKSCSCVSLDNLFNCLRFRVLPSKIKVNHSTYFLDL